ncbi:hypothetical protein TYRP_009933 [Tyrophagus putrescentiae]|nr:hypothetical protein TYRP_009933 [Tyrophagus putrescentiae]
MSHDQRAMPLHFFTSKRRPWWGQEELAELVEATGAAAVEVDADEDAAGVVVVVVVVVFVLLRPPPLPLLVDGPADVDGCAELLLFPSIERFSSN